MISIAETLETRCVGCGEPTHWLCRLDVPRTTDPEMPFRSCPRCAETGTYRRRRMTMWLDEAFWQQERAEQG